MLERRIEASHDGEERRSLRMQLASIQRESAKNREAEIEVLRALLAEAPTEEFATVVDVLAKDPNNPLGYKAASMMKVGAAAAGAGTASRGGKRA